MNNKYKDYDKLLDIEDPDACKLFDTKEDYQKMAPNAYQVGFLEYREERRCGIQERISFRRRYNVEHFYLQLKKED